MFVEGILILMPTIMVVALLKARDAAYNGEGDATWTTIRRVMLGTSRRRFFAYAAVGLSWLLYPVWKLHFQFSSATITVTLLPIVIVILFVSYAFARRESEPRQKNPLDALFMRSSGPQEDDPCVQEMLGKMAVPESSTDASLKDFFDALDVIDSAQWLVENAVTMGLSQTCIDRLLWEGIFERFEEPSRYRAFIHLLSKGKKERYKAQREILLKRDDEVGTAFRESLNRWRKNRSASR